MVPVHDPGADAGRLVPALPASARRRRHLARRLRRLLARHRAQRGRNATLTTRAARARHRVRLSERRHRARHVRGPSRERAPRRRDGEDAHREHDRMSEQLPREAARSVRGGDQRVRRHERDVSLSAGLRGLRRKGQLVRLRGLQQHVATMAQLQRAQRAERPARVQRDHDVGLSPQLRLLPAADARDRGDHELPAPAAERRGDQLGGGAIGVAARKGDQGRDRGRRHLRVPRDRDERERDRSRLRDAGAGRP